MSTVPRYFFAAMPTAKETPHWSARLTDAEVVAKLAPRMFPLDCLHQTLSGRHFDADAATVAKLMQAGSMIAAHAVTLRFNRVKWSQFESGGKIHCTLLARGRPPLFDALLVATQDALRTVGLHDDEGHSPHVTLSYNAGELHLPIWLIPIEWTISEVLLLKGHGVPYRYDIVGRWSLLPPASPQHQDDLFAFG